jgi:hypothetical protein
VTVDLDLDRCVDARRQGVRPARVEYAPMLLRLRPVERGVQLAQRGRCQIDLLQTGALSQL